MFFCERKKKIDFFYYSDIGGREKNEDCVDCILSKRGDFIGVIADGLGGQGEGSVASKIAVDTIVMNFLNTPIDNPDEYNIWFQEANQKVLMRQNHLNKMMTTLAVIQVKDNYAMWAHVGDSRIYHFVNGRLIDQSFDHSVSQMAVLCGEITQDEIRNHVDRNKLLKAIGRENTIKLDVSEKVKIDQNEHSFLLCTDGFWEYINEAEMETCLEKTGESKKWMEEMLGIVKKRAPYNQDNNSAITIIF